MRPITRDDWQRKANADPYWRDRWRYMGVAREFLLAVPDITEGSRVLELGAGGLPLCVDSDRIAKIAQGVPNTHVHDLTQFPWPIESDARYDAVVALEVLEHLSPHQAAVTAQIQRISDHFVFSVPYLWRGGDSMHRDRSLIDVQKWTGNARWLRWRVVTHDGPPILVVLACLKETPAVT